MTDQTPELATWRGQSFHVIRHPAVAAALQEFRSPFEAGTLRFFDAVLPSCDRMIDVGAYAGLMSLYAASRVADVFAFEASPTNFDLLAQNVALNVKVRDRIRLFGYGLGDCGQQVPLYRKGFADSGSSIFQTIERASIINGMPEAMVTLRNADAVLRDLGMTRRTLLKIDIEGAEYLVVPAIATLLAETKPFLHLSFHPFNLVSSGDEYTNTLRRITCALQIAEAVSTYRYMYLFEQGQWQCVEQSNRMRFLHTYLLQPKAVPRIATAQYGFVDAVGFSDEVLLALTGEDEGRAI